MTTTASSLVRERAAGAELQLVVAGYTVSYAMALITGARMGDLFGRRRMFLIGVLVFTVASLACGIAPGIEILIAARFVQGAGAAAWSWRRSSREWSGGSRTGAAIRC